MKKEESKYAILKLERTYKDDSTLGIMTFPDGEKLHTIELPWKDNKKRASCIPEGTYKMGLRVSGVVNRTSKGKYTKGWEVTNVEGRTFIMVHIGNTVDDILGCIAVGTKFGILGDNDAVYHSAVAFDIFMDKMSKNKYWKIEITKAEK